MKRLSKIALLCSSVLSLLTISCATVPPDVAVFEHLTQRLSTDPVSGHLMLTPDPICYKMIKESECGHGVFIMSGKVIYIGEKKENHFNGKPWSQVKSESVLVPAEESYAPIATYIINSCKKLNCNDDVNKYRIKLDFLNGVKNVNKTLP